MRQDWSDELNHVNFRCTVCRHAWAASPDLVEPDEAEDAAHHPFAYFARCLVCDANNQPQAAWERNLIKAHSSSTGPKSSAGKAASAANLAGHPTPEEALRTRFNAMKTGLNARVAHYFPAKPGKYPACKTCDVDHYWCSQQPACVKQTELFMLHSAAFEQRNPRMLTRIHSDIHAALVGCLQMLLQSVVGDGATLKVPKLEMVDDGEGHMRNEPVTFTDADGDVHFVYEYSAHPAFKPIADLVTRLGLSLSDLGLTAKVQNEEEAELGGRLAGDAKPLEQLADFSQRMAAVLERVPSVIADARAAAAKDPVLLEHQAQTGRGGE